MPADSEQHYAAFMHSMSAKCEEQKNVPSFRLSLAQEC